ncbi:hypothetical protein F5X97DRAFT_324626 [Nemania serpens]|nr:hypothetical protein F5X97DRAFT_324626 [Nemania serpens]
MPRLRFPQVKLSFLKKLLPNKFNKSRPEATSEPIIEISSKKQQDEKEEAKEPPPEECPICHDPVGVANPEGILESWVHLHCNHKFGTHCIQTWLEESAERDPHAIPSCPICRSAAKHPCGHPVVLPALRFSPFHMWGAPVPPTAFIPPADFFLPRPPPGGRRPRRRLARRLGHPHRPLPPRPVRAQVQTVGDCSTCVAMASAQENRMNQMAAPSVEADGTNTNMGGRGRNNDRRMGIKSMVIPISLRRRSSASLEPVRRGNRSNSVDMSSESSSPITPTPRGPRDYVNLCRTEAAVMRSPTPTPAFHQVVSF